SSRARIPQRWNSSRRAGYRRATCSPASTIRRLVPPRARGSFSSHSNGRLKMRAIAGVLAAFLVACGGGTAEQRPADDEDIDFSPEDDSLFGDGPPTGELPEEPLEETGGTEVPAGPTQVTVE